MAEIVPDTDDQSLQQFLSESKWDENAVMDAIAQRASGVLDSNQDSVLVIDETSFAKKGSHSAGVERQWLGSCGKVDNGQVGVFTALCHGEKYVLTHGQLYLPQIWTEDEIRCNKAKIPKEYQEFKTKDEIALSLVSRFQSLEVPFGWVAADAGYGKGPGFCLALHSMDLRFIVDLHNDFTVYRSNPHPYLPRKKGRGRAPSKYRTRSKAYTVKKVIELSKQKWVPLTLRIGTKGPVLYHFQRHKIWIWEKGTKEAFPMTLIARRGPNGEMKYSLTNAKDNVSLTDIAKAQGQRYWIERAFQESKQRCGLGDYQVRTWKGWHHHMALSMMALLFTTEYKIKNKEENPLMSTYDIEVLLSRFLPRKDFTPEEVLAAMEKRHQQRTKAIISRQRKKIKIKTHSNQGIILTE